MKKLKIFLLLSILLCFGFTLSLEVHAQGGGSKPFVEGVVLPVTSQLRIIVDIPSADGGMNIPLTNTTNGYLLFDVYNNGVGDEYYEDYYCDVRLNGSWLSLTDYNLSELVNNEWIPSEDEEFGYSIISFIIDTSTWTETQRTIVSDNHDTHPIYWEDLNAPSGYTITFNSNGGTVIPDIEGVTELPISLPIPTKENHTFLGWYYDDDFTNEALAGDPLSDDVTLYAKWVPGKLFEVGDVLPATTELKLRVYFKYGDYDYHVESIDRSGIYISIEWIGGAGGYLNYYLEIDGRVRYDGEATASEIYYTIDISNMSLDQRTIKSVSFENGSFATWEDTTPDGYTQGYLTAREEYGYYDSITDQWLSVEEYLDLYGTDKMGQSDFYNNFDKYFIPAMIIVFGGTIVLTILKVFKGRE